MVIVEQFVIYHYNEKQMTFIHKLYIPDCDYIAAVPLYVPAAIHTGRVIEGPWWAVDHSSPLCVQLHLTTTSSWETHTHAHNICIICAHGKENHYCCHTVIEMTSTSHPLCQYVSASSNIHKLKHMHTRLMYSSCTGQVFIDIWWGEFDPLSGS